MAKLPRVTGPEMRQFLERQGFQLLRVRGSHHFYSREELRTSVPVHGNCPLKIGSLRSILRDIQMSPATSHSVCVRDEVGLLDKINPVATRESVIRHAKIFGVLTALGYALVCIWQPAWRDMWWLKLPVATAFGGREVR